MLKDLKNTVKQSAVYGLSRVATKLISFILLPLYSVNFSVFEYGVISRIETLWQILWAVFLFGLESGVIRWYSMIQNESDKKKFLFSVTVFLLVINFFFTVLFFLSSGFFSELIFKTSGYSNLVFYASLIASVEAIAFIVFLLIRINEKALLYSLCSILIALLNLLIQVYYILYTQQKLEGVFIAKIISPAVVILFLLPYYLKFLKPEFDLKNLKELLIFSFPVMLSSLAGTLLNQSDRFILGYLGSKDDVGLYSLAYNICGLLNVFVIAPFSLAFTVISWKKLNDDNAKRFFTKSVTYLFFTIIYLAIILSLAIPFFIKIFTLNPDYWYAKEVVPWIAIAMPFYGISGIGFFSFFVTKKTSLILYFTVAALVINVLLNILLIPAFGMYGAAIANFSAFFLYCIIIYVFSRENYFFKYEWKKIFYMIILYCILVFPFAYFQIGSFTVNVLLRLIAIIAFPFILYLFDFYEPIEVERVKGFINKILKSVKF